MSVSGLIFLLLVSIVGGLGSGLVFLAYANDPEGRGGKWMILAFVGVVLAIAGALYALVHLTEHLWRVLT